MQVQSLTQHFEPQDVDLGTLQPDNFFDFSCPADRERRLRQAEAFAAFPLIVVSPAKTIVAGFEFYRLFQSRGIRQATVCAGELSKGEALCLNYNLSHALFSLNLLEKLIFTERILTVFEPEDIYRRVALDLDINKKLRSKLRLLLDKKFQHLLSHDLVNLKTALKMCDLENADRLATIELFQHIPFTSSQCLHLLEMFEEIGFRDKTPVALILKKIEIERFYQEKKPQQAVLQAIGKLRYPMFTQAEADWQARIKTLNLPGNIKVSHAPFFEKKNIDVTAALENFEQLERFSKKIGAE